VSGTATSGRRGRRLGVDIKPGTVKQARHEAGLSLAQVANGAISRTAIYFVEVGKAKPSIDTLRLIAERTGRPLDFFLARPSTLQARSSLLTAEIEQLLATGELHGGVKAGLELLEKEHDAETAARVKQLLAHAYLRLGQPREGRRLAAEARTQFESTGDVLMAAECLGHEATAAYVMQDPAAMGIAQRGLELCRSLRPTPRMTESRLLFVLAGVHATNQDWQAAIDCYDQALATGEVIQDLRMLSLIYSGLSLSYGEIDSLDEAAHYAKRALAIHETLSDRLALARSENNLGLLLIKRGELAEAEGHLVRSLALFEEAAVDTRKANVLLSLCELAHARSLFDEAEGFAVRALDLAASSSERATEAEAHVWLGRIAEERGDAAAVDGEFREAWGILDALGGGERLSRCHIIYADILERRGDLAAANKHLRAAISQLRPARLGAAQMESRIASA